MDEDNEETKESTPTVARQPSTSATGVTQATSFNIVTQTSPVATGETPSDDTQASVTDTQQNIEGEIEREESQDTVNSGIVTNHHEDLEVTFE